MKKTIAFALLAVLVVSLTACEMFGTHSESPAESAVSFAETSTGLEWPSDNALLTSVPAFSVGTITDINEKDGVLFITVANVDSEEFRMYVSSLKANGFTDTVFESETLFSAFSKLSEVELLGISVRLDGSTISIDVSKTDAIQEQSEPETSSPETSETETSAEESAQ